MDSLPWPNWSQVSDDTRKMLKQLYKDQGFCFETRLQCSDFVQSNFIHAGQTKILACQFATQLLEEMESYIKKIHGNSTFLTIESTMRETLKNLKVSMYLLIMTSLINFAFCIAIFNGLLLIDIRMTLQ